MAISSDGLDARLTSLAFSQSVGIRTTRYRRLLRVDVRVILILPWVRGRNCAPRALPDRRAREFPLIARRVRIAPNTPEFAVNASNQRHWHGPVRAYIDDCLAGTSGNGSADFNMRWIGSLVAESLRILVRGGVFLYPADARPGHRDGRLRLLYEAHPMS